MPSKLSLRCFTTIGAENEHPSKLDRGSFDIVLMFAAARCASLSISQSDIVLMFAAARCASLSDSDTDDDGDSWDWEGEGETTPASSRCLFCQQTFLTTETTWTHCRDAHGFDIVDAKRRLHLDSIGYIKMVNYIRQQEVWFDEVYRLG